MSSDFPLLLSSHSLEGCFCRHPRISFSSKSEVLFVSGHTFCKTCPFLLHTVKKVYLLYVLDAVSNRHLTFHDLMMLAFQSICSLHRVYYNVLFLFRHKKTPFLS